jgi:hypothetical protein
MTATTKTDDAQDVDEKDVKPTYEVKNKLKVEWEDEKDESGEPTGRHTVKLTGTLNFEIVESVFEDGEHKGEISYNSGLLKVAQDDLRTAINVSLKNGVGRAFIAKWDEVFPPERAARTRASLSTKNAELEARNAAMDRIIKVMFEAAQKHETPDFTALRAEGINPEDFGIAV